MTIKLRRSNSRLNFVGQRQGKTASGQRQGKGVVNGKGTTCHRAARESFRRENFVAVRQGNFCHGKRQSHGKVNSGQTAIGQTSCGKWQGKTSVASTSRQTS